MIFLTFGIKIREKIVSIQKNYGHVFSKTRTICRFGQLKTYVVVHSPRFSPFSFNVWQILSQFFIFLLFTLLTMFWDGFLFGSTTGQFENFLFLLCSFLNRKYSWT